MRELSFALIFFFFFLTSVMLNKRRHSEKRINVGVVASIITSQFLIQVLARIFPLGFSCFLHAFVGFSPDTSAQERVCGCLCHLSPCGPVMDL